MPRRKRYKGPTVFTVSGGFIRGRRHTDATVTMRPAVDPYVGYVEISNSALFDRPEVNGITSIPYAVWFDDRLSRGAAELYGVIKALHHDQSEILKKSNGKETIVINRPMIERMISTPTRTVQAWLEELIKAGHVTHEPGYRGIRSNYILNSG